MIGDRHEPPALPDSEDDPVVRTPSGAPGVRRFGQIDGRAALRPHLHELVTDEEADPVAVRGEERAIRAFGPGQGARLVRFDLAHVES